MESFNDYYLKEDIKDDFEKVLLNENIDAEFIKKLLDHIDKIISLPYGTMDSSIYNELRKHCIGLSNEKILKLKKQIHTIIKKQKDKLLTNIGKRVSVLNSENTIDNEPTFEKPEENKTITLPDFPVTPQPTGV